MMTQGLFYSARAVVSAYSSHDPSTYQKKDDARVSQENAFQSRSGSTGTMRQISFILCSSAVFDILCVFAVHVIRLCVLLISLQ
mmetsp:Transcript_26231/g.39046  ORF Transcript_26231/g.39046 Transcript_26231/m.39046 type:complete len:84 (+) Transcript_26231:736-987(+)